MTYTTGAPVRQIAGRLALDFLNTANWSEDGSVAWEKLVTPADLEIWLDALCLGDAVLPDDFSDVIDFRRKLRQVFNKADAVNLDLKLSDYSLDGKSVRTLPFLELVAMSATVLLADPREMARLKICPGNNCGWMFIDETKNGRRTWCTMDLCGNRAKAARHYKRTRES